MKLKQYLILEMSLQKAEIFATNKHKGQIRKSSGEPYVNHPKGVFNLLKSLHIKDNTLLVAAYLHDTLEDTKTTYNEIKREFSKEVADIVKQVSSDNKEIQRIGKPNYLANKMIKMSNNALIIKLVDRLHNLSDIMSVSKDFAEKMWSQTTFIIKKLRKERTLNNIQKKIIRLINKSLKKYKPLESNYEI